MVSTELSSLIGSHSKYDLKLSDGAKKISNALKRAELERVTVEAIRSLGVSPDDLRSMRTPKDYERFYMTSLEEPSSWMSSRERPIVPKSNINSDKPQTQTDIVW